MRVIEEGLGIEFSDLIDQIGLLAWVSIINQFVPILIGLNRRSCGATALSIRTYLVLLT